MQPTVCGPPPQTKLAIGERWQEAFYTSSPPLPASVSLLFIGVGATDQLATLRTHSLAQAFLHSLSRHF